ncbi:MAG: hypothetical protein Q8910_00480 [Bacteroidota bacterium]|nr:hypothetical protein [Bacteroidota bacterium]
MSKFTSAFTLTKINHALEEGVGPSYIAFIVATVMRCYGKIDSLHWMIITILFILYKMVKKYIVPLIKIGGAYVGVKDLNITEDNQLQQPKI